MTYDQLVDFVQNRMRMSHVYQPVMLAALLAHGGKCSTEEIARAILAHDESQVEYYENVTKNMVGRVLKGHGIVEREDDGYSLVGYEDLGDEEIEYLIELCEGRRLSSTRTERGGIQRRHQRRRGRGTDRLPLPHPPDAAAQGRRRGSYWGRTQRVPRQGGVSVTGPP